jgi:gamma-glutamyltranspeptidase
MIGSAFAPTKVMPRTRRGRVVAEHPLGTGVGASILAGGAAPWTRP